MKIKIFISIILSAIITLSCSTNGRHVEENEKQEEHEEHELEGVVKLNKQQRDALNLKLGGFEMRNLTTVVKTNGQLTVPPTAKADVTAIIGGYVKNILVFHGDKVSKGQSLAVLEHPDYISLQENFLVSAGKLEYLEKEYERQKKLYENNVGAGKDFEQIKSELAIEKARFESLKLRLKLLNLSPEKVIKGIISNTIRVVAPISGYISDIEIRVGTYVDARDKLFGVTDNSAIHADFMVYENDVRLIHEGQKIHFTVSSQPEDELEAIVFAIGKEFEPNTRSVHIHASIIGEHDNLIPGMYISGHLHTDKKYTNTLPNDAVVNEGVKSFIFVLVDDAEDAHDHKDDEKGESEETHNHSEMDHDEYMSFKKVEVITGRKDGRYTEVQLIDSMPNNAQFVINGAYYLLSDLSKEETEHNH